MERADRYTVTIYTAAPGTPLVDAENVLIPKGRSDVGHMYLVTSNGTERVSAGWQLGKPAQGGGYLGTVSPDDVKRYVDPYYARTLEITKEQFDKIREFTKAPQQFGFDLKYNAFTNSCTDFAWGALNHAGLHGEVLGVPVKGFEGVPQPARNTHAIDSIKAPFPDSPLNKVERNPMPERKFWQKLISDEDRSIFEQINRGVAALDASHGRTPDETSERMCGSLFCLAKENGLSRVDHVLLSKADAQGQSGTNVFVVQGEPSDPAHLRASMPTAVAAQTPLQESMERAERIVQSQASAQVATQQQTQVQEQQAVAQRMA